MFSLLCAVLLAPPVEPAPKGTPPAESANRVEGLELPADQKVDADEGSVTLAAKTSGEVRWLVIGPGKIKTLDADKEITIVFPHAKGAVIPGDIQVFAVALVDGKLTAFASTTVSVQPPRAGPAARAPGDTPAPGPVSGKVYVTLVLDYDKLTPAQGTLANSAIWKDQVRRDGGEPYVYPTSAVVLKPPPGQPGGVQGGRDLGRFVEAAGGPPAVIVQDSKGKVLARERLPEDEAGLLALLARVRREGR